MGDGRLVGIPTSVGTFTINVTATDLNNCPSAPVAVTFTVGCPQITPTPDVLPDATVGVQYDQTITLNGVESFTIGANDDTDVSFSFPFSIFASGTSTTIRIMGTAAPGTAGTYSIVVRRTAAHSFGGSDACTFTQVFTLRVNDPQ